MDGIPFYVSVATRCKNQPDPGIAAAQRAIVNTSVWFYEGPDTDDLGEDYRHDNCHFNEAGVDEVALRWYNILAAE